MIKLAGIQALKNALKIRTMACENDVSKIIKVNGAEMQRKAMRAAPVDTGFLKRSITLDVNALQAKVTSEAEYAAYQEYGTRFQSGTPHIRPAFYDQKPIFLKDMEKLAE